MNNVNAAAHLHDYAARNGIDLAEYHAGVQQIFALGEFIDPEPPFAQQVLNQLTVGKTISEAVAIALDEAHAHLNE